MSITVVVVNGRFGTNIAMEASEKRDTLGGLTQWAHKLIMMWSA